MDTEKVVFCCNVPKKWTKEKRQNPEKWTLKKRKDMVECIRSSKKGRIKNEKVSHIKGTGKRA